MYEGLRSPEWLLTVVVALLSYGCPLQAIVQAFGLDERTVARWIERAGKHCEQVHSERIVQKELDLQHVQADEVYVKCYRKVAWVAMAIMVPTRLWLGGVVSQSRDHKLTDQLLRLVRACCLPLAALLVCCDGFAAYPGSIYRAFRDKVANPYGIGRTRARSVAGNPYWHRQQTPAGETGRASHTRNAARVAGTSHRRHQGHQWRGRDQHGLYRAVQCNPERTAGSPDPPLSPYFASYRDGDCWHVAGWHHLQLVPSSSGTQPPGSQASREARGGLEDACDG